MTLLYIYVATFVLGGILLGASLLMGHDDADAHAELDAGGGVDHDVDLDADHDVDLDADHDVHLGDADATMDGTPGVDISDFWLPFLSVRFWVFFLCFFGLTGLALTLLSLAGPTAGLAASVGVGGASGFGAAFIIQRLKHAEVGASASVDDFRGKEGRVLLPIEAGSKGKVRINIQGSLVDLVAHTDEDVVLVKGSPVMVVEVKGSEAWVVPAPELGEGPERKRLRSG